MTATSPVERPSAASAERLFERILNDFSIIESDRLVERGAEYSTEHHPIVRGDVEGTPGIFGFAVALSQRFFGWLTDLNVDW